jgi:SAM-dependent methyltransferase
MLPNVTRSAGLDLGCGEGHNTRLLARRGAHMTAIDIARRFVQAAAAEERREPLGIRYLQGSAVALPFADEAFDFVVAFMSLMDMAELDRVLAEVHRVLRRGGFLQLSIEHPCTTTPRSGWVTDEHGKRVARTIGDYFDQEPHLDTWIFGAAPPELRHDRRPFQIPRFPRTLSAWLNSIASAGLVLEAADEPYADEAAVAHHPRLDVTRTAPLFLHLRSRKSTS